MTVREFVPKRLLTNEIDPQMLVQGNDVRTTVMIKNIPNRYTTKLLVEEIDEKFKSTYNFLYLPTDKVAL